MIQIDKSATLSTDNNQTLFEPIPFCKSARAQTADDATTWKEGKVANCLNTFDIGEKRCNELVVGLDVCNQETTGDKARTLLSERTDSDHLPCVLAFDRAAFNQGDNAQFNFSVDEDKAQTVVAKGLGGVCCFAPSSGEVADTLDAHYYLGCGNRGGKEREIIGQVTYSTSHGTFHTQAEEEEVATLLGTDYKDPPIVNDLEGAHYIVRRLTPIECGRLQGMPDWWCSDVEHSDAAEYKMWGNGMALPNILYVVENTVRVLKGED